MEYDIEKIFLWEGLHWAVEYDSFDEPITVLPLCSNQRCNTLLRETYDDEIYGSDLDFFCPKCRKEYRLRTSIVDIKADIIAILTSEKYKNSEIVNIDGELIPVQPQKKVIYDDKYWVTSKISKDRKGKVQLMVLAGINEIDDKVQLFVSPDDEKMTFDQNNLHPRKVLTKVTAEFKNSKTSIVGSS